MSASELGRSETEQRPDGRPLALGGAAWSAMWIATSDDVVWWVVGLAGVGVLAGLALRRRSRFVAALAVLALACLAAGGLRVWQQANGPLTGLAREGAVATVELVVDATARSAEPQGVRPAWWSTTARAVRVEARGGVWLTGERIEVSASGDAARAWAQIPLGATVRATVRLSPAEPGVAAAVAARAREPPQVVAEPDALAAGVGRVRAGLREASAGLAPDPRALVPALVVGDTSGIGDDLAERFRVTGLTHLCAVSGANLTLLLAFVRAVAVGVGVRGRWLDAVLVAGVAGFIVLCLGEPSVVRAAAMGLVGLAAVGWGGRGRQGLRYLGVAILVLMLVDPWLSRSVGFALSGVASFGLLWWAGRWTDLLARWLPRVVAEAVAVPLAAQLATEPIVVALSGRVSVVGLLANALAGPLVGPATVLGFLAAGLSVVWLPAASACAWLAGWCAQGLCWIARLGDALPGAAIPWPATPVAVALVALACLCVAALAPVVLARRWLSLGVAAVLVATLVRTPTPPGWPPPDWLVVSCDVGQGDATLVRAGPGAAVLIDAGPDARALERCLAQVGVRSVPLVVLTHLHADHVSGLPAVAGRRPGLVVTSAVTSPAYGEGIVRALGVPRQVAHPGQVWQAGEARVQVLAAPALAADAGAGEGESSGENDASLVLRVSVGGVSALLLGDTEAGGQARLVGLGADADVEVLLVPHHGSSRQSPEFLASTSPQVALVSVGAHNDYGHPTAKTLRLVAGLGARIVRTDEHGSIAVRGSPGHLTLTTQR